MDAITRRRRRAVLTFATVGALAGLVIGVGVSQIDDADWLTIGARGLIIGLMIGASVGVGEQWGVPALSRRIGFRALNATRLIAYAAAMLLALVIVNSIGEAVSMQVSFAEGVRMYLLTDGTAPRDFALTVLAALGMTTILELRSLHNRGEVWRFLSGRYRYPKEEVRVFLFADLVGSTSLAERLGNLEYSSLLRDCFRDTSEAALAWGADVYQYAGDGVILTWREADGLEDAACLRCYFEMRNALARRDDQYQERYGVSPRLRGAAHGGTVVTTWVGEAKRELAFHGDTLNAAARIEAMTKEVGSECLVSAWVMDRITLPAGLEARDIGEVTLRGMAEPMVLHAVARREP